MRRPTLHEIFVGFAWAQHCDAVLRDRRRPPGSLGGKVPTGAAPRVPAQQGLESVQPDGSDPGWQDVEHDNKSLDCISQDHTGCFLPLHCQCECHQGRTPPVSTPEEGS